MTKIDDSYMERLKEKIYDEKKAINYKMVSIMMGVHVNIAKQMLYHFYSSEKELGKKVFATFFVSGMLPRKMLNSIGKKEERSHDSSSQEVYCSPSDELDSFLVLLCRDRDLEEYKSKFSKIFSIHVYALSGFPLENYDTLESLAGEPLRDSEGRTPVDFGPITCSAAQKLKKNSRPVHVVKDVPKAKDAPKPKAFFGNGKASDDKSKTIESNSKEATKKSDSAASSDVASGETQVNNSKGVKVADPIKKGTDNNRLKSMFATQASKPKPKVEEKKKSMPSKSKNPKDSSVSKSEAKATNSDTRKRKRIRDVLSSSESEEEKGSDVEESLPESPVPKRRIQIESDSDDDFKEEPIKAMESEEVVTTPKENTVAVSGRKRVAKMVSKSYLDKDGFLVTKKEQVMVSEDEGSDSEKPKNGSHNGKSVQSKPDEQKRVKPNVKKSPISTGKAKQSSLMSFFQKK
ncbi:unnamed protein product [Orchesella dallaii]|uniref:DNA polymerase delta subunit 3 n=1 Tax=Orchesella dallaii TaxID=48710 RepID=A0ABP1Q9I3_9HEXA